MDQEPNPIRGEFFPFADLMPGMASGQQKNIALKVHLVAPGEEEFGPYVLNEEMTHVMADGSSRTIPVENVYVSTANGRPIFPSSMMRQVWLAYDGHLITSPALRGVCASRYHASLGANRNFLREEELTSEQLSMVNKAKEYCPECRCKEKRRSRCKTIATICTVLGFLWLLGKVPPDWFPKEPAATAGVEQLASPSHLGK